MYRPKWRRFPGRYAYKFKSEKIIVKTATPEITDLIGSLIRLLLKPPSVKGQGTRDSCTGPHNLGDPAAIGPWNCKSFQTNNHIFTFMPAYNFFI